MDRILKLSTANHKGIIDVLKIEYRCERGTELCECCDVNKWTVFSKPGVILIKAFSEQNVSRQPFNYLK